MAKQGMVDWCALPRELVQSIAERVSINEDYVHLRAVCAPWRAATSPRPRHLPIQSPWLMLSYADSNACDFLCMSSNKIYRNQLPESHSKRCCGSSHGWVILLENDQGASLLNPLTREQIPLPPISVFPTVFSMWLEEEEEDVDWEAVYACRNLNDPILEKIVLSSSPTLDEETIALALVSEKMAYCKLGEESWALMQDSTGFYTDAIYHQGKFYVVDSLGMLLAVEFAPYPQTRVRIIVPPVHCSQVQCYVVESRGDIYLVSRIPHVCNPERHASGATVAFEVFSVNLDGQQQQQQQQQQWVEVENLGGRSFFVGVNHSISFLADDIPGVEENCIYFTDDFCWRYKGDDEFDACARNDLGIFNLADNSIRPLPLNIDRSRFSWPPPKWIFPSLC